MAPNPVGKQVVEILRNAITSCFFEPGGKLTERALCEHLGVSRGTVREGLRQLEAEGLVQIAPNRGPMVTVLTEAEAEEIYSVRALIEGEASALAAHHREPQALVAMRRELAAMRLAKRAGDFAALQSAKTRFYNALFESVRNGHLERLLKQMRARNTLVRGLAIDRERRMSESIRGAREILAAIAAGDEALARQATRSHIERAAALALAAMRSATAGGNTSTESKRTAMPRFKAAGIAVRQVG